MVCFFYIILIVSFIYFLLFYEEKLDHFLRYIGYFSYNVFLFPNSVDHFPRYIGYSRIVYRILYIVIEILQENISLSYKLTRII